MPAELAAFDPAQWPPADSADDELEDAAPWEQEAWREIFAHRRWRRARQDWLLEHGAPGAALDERAVWRDAEAEILGRWARVAEAEGFR